MEQKMTELQMVAKEISASGKDNAMTVEGTG